MQTVSTSGVLQKLDPACWRDHRFGLPYDRWARLNGKSFWITGAGTGYGRSISLGLAAAGAHVFLTGRRIEKLQETLNEGYSLGINIDHCIPVPADITQESDLACAVETISQHTSRLYGLVNSAALPQPNAGPYPLADQSVTSWIKLLTTNITGQWLATKAALPLLVKEDGFRAVFLSSEAAWASTPGFGPYNVCKSAMNTLGASFAAECAMRFPGKDVQINVLVPGEAHTEMNQGSTESPYSVVGMVLILLSHPPGGPNGCFFHQDGRHLGFGYASPFSKSLLGN